MKSRPDIIATHYSNDDMRHFAFSRTSGLGRDYFPRTMTFGRAVGLVCYACAVLVAAPVGMYLAARLFYLATGIAP